MKKTFKIPAGCKEITIEQIGNTIVTSFEEKFKPKHGDICVWNESQVRKNSNFYCKYPIIGIYGVYGEIIGLSMSRILSYDLGYGDNNFRLATDPEKQLLFDALARAGKRWNADKLCIESLKWEPKIGDFYYSFGWGDKNRFDDDNIDRWRLEHNLVFKTEEERDAALLKFNSINK